MRPDWRRTVTTVTTVWAAAAAVVLCPLVVVTAPSGLLLVSLPGIVWLRAAHRSPIAPLERWILVAALDLGLIAATAFALNVVPGGLRGVSWALALASVTTVGALVDAFRGRLASGEGGQDFPHGVRSLQRPTRRQGVAVVMGVVFLTAAGVLSVTSAHTSADEHFTELSLVPSPPARHPTSAVLLVSNHEQSTTRYRVVLTTGSKTSRQTITLKVGTSYRRLVPMSGGTASVTLYRGNDPYRHVWIGDPQGSPRP